MRKRLTSTVIPRVPVSVTEHRRLGQHQEGQRRINRSLAVLVASLAIVGVAGNFEDASASGTLRATAAKRCRAQGHGFVKRLLRLHNIQRRRHHLHGLRRNTALSRAARHHACEMVSHHYFGHVSPSGKGPVDRVAATGYGDGRSWSMDENILCWSPSLSPAQAMGKWLRSATHRANILKGRWRDVGIAAIAGSPTGGGLTLVVEFGRRLRRR
jgi:uncharacterized protein YkwD